MSNFIRNLKRDALRRVARAVALTGVILMTVACNQGAEGDRCNPDLFKVSSDCNDGLTCTTFAQSCGESYCCPSDPTKSTNGYCNGKLWCPAATTSTPTPMSTTDAGTTN